MMFIVNQCLIYKLNWAELEYCYVIKTNYKNMGITSLSKDLSLISFSDLGIIQVELMNVTLKLRKPGRNKQQIKVKPI